MKEFDRIKDMIYDELDEVSHRDKLSKETVCIIGELVDILKDIGSIEMFEEGVSVTEDGYSFDNWNMPNNGGYSNRRSYYNDGSSYEYGGYSRRSGRRGGYSRDDGKKHMIEKLHSIMNEASDQKDKESIQRLIDQMNHEM